MINPINNREIKPEDLTLQDVWEIYNHLNDEGLSWLHNEILKHGTIRIERAMDSLRMEAMLLLEDAKERWPENYADLMAYFAKK